MKKTGFVFRIFFIFIAAVLLAQAVQPARASTPAAPLPQQEGTPETITFARWGYEDVTLFGPFSNAVYSLGLPAHWEVLPGSTLNLMLDFSVSKVTGIDLADIVNLEDYAPAVVVQIVLNGETVHTIDEVAVGASNIVVPLPDVWPQPEGDANRLQIIMRIHGRCEFYPVSSLVIGSDSNVSLTYRERDLPLDLASYPQPFYQRTFMPNNLTIVIPESPTAAEIGTAFSIAAGLGARTSNQVPLTTITDAEFAAEPAAAQADNLILVGTPSSNTVIAGLMESGSLPMSAAENPGAASGLTFTYNGSPVDEGDGILQLVTSPWKTGKAVLVVTGLSDAAVTKAGRALGLPTNFPGMAGPVALIADILPESASGDARPSSFTFAELGYNDETFVGIGQKNIFYQFFVPFNWMLTQDASIDLHFSHSALLDPDQSSISIFLNDKPIATAALDEANSINGVLTGLLSARDVRPGLTNTLLVLIEGELPDPCVIPESSQAWVSVSADSTVNLAHSEVDVKGLKDLDYWPQMFINSPRLTSVMLALPQQPTTAEWKLASQVSAYMGASNGSGDVQMNILLGDPGDADLSGYDILVIGRPTRSPLLQSLNDQLPQPFIPGTDGIQQKVDDVVFRLPDGLELGYLQLLPSPWNPDRTLMALTGTTDAAVEQASQYLVNSDLVWQLEGNLALVRNGQVFTTDTREQTGAAAAQFTATLVPETSQAVQAPAPEQADPTATPRIEPVEQAAPLSYPQRYPYLLPGILGGGVLVIVGLLLSGLFIKRRPR